MAQTAFCRNGRISTAGIAFLGAVVYPTATTQETYHYHPITLARAAPRPTQLESRPRAGPSFHSAKREVISAISQSGTSSRATPATNETLYNTGAPPTTRTTCAIPVTADRALL
ncbi:MAG: hypothetical protein R2862_08425 [Thermoanaerobaculia bacterium]